MRKKTIKSLIVAILAIIVGFLVLNSLDISSQEAAPTPTLSGFANTFPTKTAQPTATKIVAGQFVLLDVPFTAQAPFGNWADERQQDGCEEASALMAVRWARGQSLTLKDAEKEILAISDFELAQYGGFHDTSVADTISRIFVAYFNFKNVEARYGISSTNIIAELTKGNLIVIPANGRKLNNPNFTPPGPTHHMLVIRGYDPKTNEFITNDPGTRKGENYRYSVSTIMNAIYDYKTGHDEPVTELHTAMIVVKK